MKKSLLAFIIFFLALATFTSDNSFAYTDGNQSSSAPSLVNPIDYLKKNFPQYAPNTQSIGTSMPTLQTIQNLIPRGIFGSSPVPAGGSFSTSDIPGALKSIATLAINLFLIVIQTIAGILKALLPLLK